MTPYTLSTGASVDRRGLKNESSGVLSPQLYWRFGVCVNPLRRRKSIGVCRGGVCASDLSPQFFWALAEEVSV